ncbi:hypothetical protein [Rhodococcoides fascians]|nr:hypothetical protein [Rhodococcus fascians]
MRVLVEYDVPSSREEMVRSIWAEGDDIGVMETVQGFGGYRVVSVNE